MQGGNGHKPINVVRGFLPWQRAKPPPSGPFNGATVMRVLEEQGWMPEETASDEWMVWRHPSSTDRVTINPHWESFWEDDPIFRCLCRDLGLSAEQLLALLESV